MFVIVFPASGKLSEVLKHVNVPEKDDAYCKSRSFKWFEGMMCAEHDEAHKNDACGVSKKIQ